ncbi:MAG: ATP-binding cassette domain-containing protein, partial [Phaeobacter gallaeciensis]
MLHVSSLEKRFGGLRALDDVSFSVGQGKIKAVIGPHGAAKTTLINLIARTLRPTAGEVSRDRTPLGG